MTEEMKLKTFKKMEDVIEDLGYDIVPPMIDHSLSSATIAGHAAIKLHQDIERLAMAESTMETAKACMESQRLLFICITTYTDRMNVELVLATDTLHHMPLNEQVLAILSDAGLREEVAVGQWISGYKLIISLSVGDDVREVYCKEGTVESLSKAINIDLHAALPAIQHAVLQEQSGDKRPKLSAKFFLSMKNQEYGDVYKRSIRIDPALFNCFNQLIPLIASSAYYRAGEGSGAKGFLFVNTHIHSKESILSTISTHLRTGFRPCPLTDKLKLPTESSDRYKNYADCLKVYALLESQGLLESCTSESKEVGMTLCIGIPSETLAALVEAGDSDCVVAENSQLSMQASCIPVVLSCMPTIRPYLDNFDPSGMWQSMQSKEIQEKLLQKQGLLQSAQQKLKQSKVLDKIGNPGGFEYALRRLTDGSDLLGGMHYLMKPGAEHRLDETCDLETLSQQLIQTAGPEFVRGSVGSALLGRYRQDSLL